MRERTFRLRTVLQAITIAVMILALALTGSLFVMTQYLNRVSAALAAGVENVRAIEETQIALLRHARSPEPGAQSEFEAELLRNLAEVRRGATQEVLDSVDHAEATVRTYLEAEASEPPPADLIALFTLAFDALDAVSDLNILEAREARDTAAHWDRVLRIAGTAAAACVLVLTGWLLWWMRTQAFQPVFALARAMEAFARGHHEARAEERGPTELREMVEQFNQMAAALSAQRRARTAFLAGVAHDLRNPLNALGLAVAQVQPGQPLPPEPKLRRTIELVQRQLQKLERMVNDFMDMAQIDAGQLKLRFGEHDLGALVQEVVSLFAVTGTQHRIELSLPASGLRARCDALRVEQVVSNLISNAIKYSPSAERIEVTLAREGEHALITVRDYGIGLSDEDRQHLFEPFQRAKLAREATIPGAGLGLYVVYRLVTAHGGKIDVFSRPGEGSRFRVSLPLDEPQVRAASPSAA